jgi:hypothetical protein
MSEKRSKIKNEHSLRPNNFQCSEFLERILLLVSEEAGGNVNSQVSKAHGMQVLAVREARRRGCKNDFAKLYNIK